MHRQARKTRKLANERDYVRRNLALLIGSSQERTAVREDDSRTHEAAGSTGDEGAKILSAVPPGSYYIYSYDGKLMAEYNGAGQLVRDYIYIGNQLVAEYQGSTTYFYYATDQVNSTRAVTNGSGTVVYSVAYDPYGGIQKTWGTPTYTPSLKFSGKERDAESGLDYFGARYYANFSYRWLSADPVINRPPAQDNPQLWNLYAFCKNNPVTYWDPTGMDFITIQQGLDITKKAPGWEGTPYKWGGFDKKKGADCIGSTWGVMKDAGFDYTRQPTDTFAKSLEEGQVNDGKFRQIPDQNSPQAGDIGLTDGHMMIYSGKKGDKNEDYVWSARREGRVYGEYPLKWFASDVKKEVVWYRYYLPDQPNK